MDDETTGGPVSDAATTGATPPAAPGGPAEKRQNPRSQTDLVVDEIKAMIVRGDLGPGSRLPIEKDLAARLGVSRSPLREGVRSLAAMGVLESRQGDGTYVTSLDASLLLAPLEFLVNLQSPDESENLASVRRLLEVEAAARATLRITAEELADAEGLLDSISDIVDEPVEAHHDAIMDVDIRFHRVIAHAAGNPALEALIEAFANRTVRARTWRALTEQGVVPRTHEEHRAILKALASGDPDRARLAMSVHLLEVEDFLAEHPLSS
ncbi:GntR family transcriptional regulator [Labedella gwakjiensis]|uniref:FadR family transcriptional regulator n=1 Tax=Labedella gwakjiensis TaxID=390269 RepID=A0A2P8GU84_9MICO|nr:FadR/GntR family transcriptional regulator [Labedella gwakjiensis]PSL37515.1 GntR family transcriptional regulator [Labedella gwakjiensis]RUQ84816.1 FadR family transcriptional regulator [Labedella gwakjiensis]